MEQSHSHSRVGIRPMGETADIDRDCGEARMQNDSILDRVRLLGLERAAYVNWEHIPFMQDVRRMCEMNTCGNYGSNWMCPPAIGEMEELRGELERFGRILLLQQVRGLEDSFDFDGMMQAKDDLAGALYSVREILEAQGVEELLLLGAGGCRLCERCTYPDAPCRNPDRALHSVEGCGIHVVELCNRAGFRYNNGPGTVTNFGMAFFNPPS